MIGSPFREKPQMMQAVLTVKEKIFLTPHYIRVILQGENMNQFAAARLGDNNKIIIPENRNTPIQLPNFERGRGGGNGARPTMRTYTLRHLDLENSLMSIDFVAHGDNGPASKWAINTEPGEELGVLMKVKDKPLLQPADWYLLVGDHTALPVISVMLESLPENAQGKAVIEVYGKEDVLELIKPNGIDIIWTFNNHPGEESTLTEYFHNADFPTASKFVFAAAEQKAVENIRENLRNNPNLQRHEWQALSYWKFGQSEDASSSERREFSHRN